MNKEKVVSSLRDVLRAIYRDCDNSLDMAYTGSAEDEIQEFVNALYDADKDTLISNQALKIQEQEIKIKEMHSALDEIYRSMVCIGGPLNDNVKMFNRDQRKIFHEFVEIIERVI